MRLVILVCQLALILRTEAQIPDECITSDTNRAPENTDITVECGTEYMEVSIFLCPVYNALYNESLMVPNNQMNTPECIGTPDWTVNPPVLRFRFPLNESSVSSCNNLFTVITQVGSGQFADFSNVQYVNISGIISSVDPSQGSITYRLQILYKYSCFYPMQYLLNNTELAVSGASLAIRDNNGSFITTLSMALYGDEEYTEILNIPQTGLNLKTKIYVAVKATNLTERFNVLLDRCYATTSPYLIPSTSYDLFVGCQRDAQTQVKINGESQIAHFSFEAFRFVEHKDRTISTFYLHCVTRLCEVDSCSTLLPVCGSDSRRKRDTSGVMGNTTVTSPKIVVGQQTSVEAQTLSAPYSPSHDNNYSSPVVAVIVCIVILAIVIVAMSVYFALYVRPRKPSMQ
ncbi:zona pellucida-like domain-containing protein 1 [Centropristis striata]|uniref:zona pellucida-like domain-containing protein 1 n=1 Tax=Centropristis striata TaxID=184440 RepID=UPI0027DFBBDF|nr:zona pellucida-like domain-containing protein 1 [Centropristis striata]